MIKMVGVDRWRRETKNQTSTTTKVINKSYASRTAQRLAVYIGRPTKWGNIFPLRKERWRDEICDKYEVYIATRYINGEITDEDFKEFDGRNLLCFCKPKRCHGDTLLLLYNMNSEQRRDWCKERIERG